MEKLLQQYKAIEKYAHVGFDDVMNKVSQEIAELVEAVSENNLSEIHKEAADVLVNLLSVSQDLGIVQKKYSSIETDIIPLVIKHGKWNSSVNAYRNRYSKKSETLENVSIITKNLINNILSFLPQETAITQILESSIQKINSRKDLYKPEIILENFISNFQDFPKKGIHFRDVSPLLQNPEALKYACMELAKECQSSDVIVGLDARGFIFGSIIAHLLDKPFVMVRKSGKLPGETAKISYGLEYGKDVIELQIGSIKKGQKIALIDDLLATGGTIQAAIDLVESQGGEVDVLGFVIALDEVGLVSIDSRKKLEKYNIQALLSYKD